MNDGYICLEKLVVAYGKHGKTLKHDLYIGKPGGELKVLARVGFVPDEPLEIKITRWLRGKVLFATIKDYVRFYGEVPS